MALGARSELRGILSIKKIDETRNKVIFDQISHTTWQLREKLEKYSDLKYKKPPTGVKKYLYKVLPKRDQLKVKVNDLIHYIYTTSSEKDSQIDNFFIPKEELVTYKEKLLSHLALLSNEFWVTFGSQTEWTYNTDHYINFKPNRELLTSS